MGSRVHRTATGRRADIRKTGAKYSVAYFGAVGPVSVRPEAETSFCRLPDWVVELVFPADRTVGTVDWDQGWDATAGPRLATGVISVPDHAKVSLRVWAVSGSEKQGRGWVMHGDASNSVDLHFLAALPPSAIDSLAIDRADPATFAPCVTSNPGSPSSTWPAPV